MHKHPAFRVLLNVFFMGLFMGSILLPVFGYEKAGFVCSSFSLGIFFWFLWGLLLNQLNKNNNQEHHHYHYSPEDSAKAQLGESRMVTQATEHQMQNGGQTIRVRKHTTWQ